MNFTIAKAGPGLWYEYHRDAASCHTLQQCQEFVTRMKQRANTFPCLECRPHFINYLKLYPFVGMTREALLYETWALHRVVNLRLNKPNIDWEIVRTFYLDSDGICTDCGVTNVQHPLEKKNILTQNKTYTLVSV
jgi:hypothetical protein